MRADPVNKSEAKNVEAMGIPPSEKRGGAWDFSKPEAENVEAAGIPPSEKRGGVWDFDAMRGIEGNGTHRGLKSRHIQLIALGGVIGTGLFVGSGVVLSLVGPASLFLSYVFMSTILWVVMNVLGEMTTFLPVTGVSVPYFVNRFCGPSLAYAAGMNYWYAYAMLVGTEVTAAGLIIEYWTTKVNIGVWITIVLVVCLLLNTVAVAYYGEAEFWFASLKIIGILGLIVLGIVLFFGGGPNHDRLGFRYWKDDKAFLEYLVPGNTGKFLGFWTAFARSGFSFILSPELVTVCAGESVAPRRDIPKATRRFIWRLVTFYILGSLVIGVIVSSDDPDLLAAVEAGDTNNARASPFVLGIQRAGIGGLNHVINAVVLTSAWSAGNSFLFAGSRILFSLARSGQAPKFLGICNKWGVPYPAVLVTWAVACLAYLNVSNSAAKVFTWFMNLTTISGYIAWIVVLITYLRFRKAIQIQGVNLPFKTPLQPYATYYALFLMIILTLTNGFHTFFGFNAQDFVAAYVTLPIFLVLWLGHKAWTRTGWRWRKAHEIDVRSGVEEIEELERLTERREPRNWLERFWWWLA